MQKNGETNKHVKWQKQWCCRLMLALGEFESGVNAVQQLVETLYENYKSFSCYRNQGKLLLWPIGMIEKNTEIKSVHAVAK